MSVVAMARLVRDVEREGGLSARLREDPMAVLSRYSLSPAEYDALLDLDAQRLVDLGLNPIPMRNLLTLLGVPGPELYQHRLSLRVAAE